MTNLPQYLIKQYRLHQKIRKKREIERSDTYAIKLNKFWIPNTYHEMTLYIVLTCNEERFHKERVNIEIWYFKVTFENIFFISESWNISEIQTTNNFIYTLATNFIFNFRICKIFSFLLNFADFLSASLYLHLIKVLHSPVP